MRPVTQLSESEPEQEEPAGPGENMRRVLAQRIETTWWSLFVCGASLCAGNAASEQKPPQQPTEKKAAKAKKAAADKKATAAGAATGEPQQPANVDPEPNVEAQPQTKPKGKAKGKAKQSATPSAAGSQLPAKKAKVSWAGELGGAGCATDAAQETGRCRER